MTDAVPKSEPWCRICDHAARVCVCEYTAFAVPTKEPVDPEKPIGDVEFTIEILDRRMGSKTTVKGAIGRPTVAQLRNAIYNGANGVSQRWEEKRSEMVKSLVGDAKV